MIAFSRRRTLGTLPFLNSSTLLVTEEIDDVFIPIDLRPKWASHWTQKGTEEYSSGSGIGKPSDFHGGPSRLSLNRRSASLPPNADIIPPARFANRRGSTPTPSISEEVPAPAMPASRLTCRRASLPPKSDFFPGQSRLLNRRGSSSPGPKICVYDDNSETTERFGLSPRTRRSYRTTGRSICSSDGKSSDIKKAQMITLYRGQRSPRRKMRPVTPIPATCSSANVEQITSETVLFTPKPPSIASPRSKGQQTKVTANVLANGLRQPHTKAKLNKEVIEPQSEYTRQDRVTTDINTLRHVTIDLSNKTLQFKTDENKKCFSDSGSNFGDSADIKGCKQGLIQAFKELNMLNSSLNTEFAEAFRFMTKRKVERILNWLDDVDVPNTRSVRTGNKDITVIRDHGDYKAQGLNWFNKFLIFSFFNTNWICTFTGYYTPYFKLAFFECYFKIINNF